MHVLATALIVFATVAVAPRAFAGGSLENIQRSHSSPSSSSSSSSSKSSSSSSSSSSSGSSSSSSSSSSSTSDSSSSEAGEALAELFVLGVVRLVTMPVYYSGTRATEEGERVWRQPARDPYGAGGAHAALGWRNESPPRWLEVGTDSTAFAAGLFSARATASVSLASLRIEGQFMRLWEPDASRVKTLDNYAVTIGLNVLNATELPAELYLKAGPAGITGASGVGYGFDARVYPMRPLVIHASLDATSFAAGPPLLFARFGPGISLGRYEARLEGTFIHQAGAITSLGPTASLGVRF